MTDEMAAPMFVEGYRGLAQSIHATAVDKGWWDKPRNEGEILCLIHSKISEALVAKLEYNKTREHMRGGKKF